MSESEIYERLARLETIVENQSKEMDDVKADLKALTVKADQILSYAQWGKGAVWGVLKVAGLLAVIGSAIAWLYDRFAGLGPHT
jgi:tetrahydromethanopterin S-methyltransferase subunit B